jgi:hypothetical protein
MFGPNGNLLTNAIQTNMLQRGFIDPLINELVYREISDKEEFEGKWGTTITKTRMGLMIPNMNPLDPSTNTNIDNGLTPITYSDEQYTVGIAQYPQPAPNVNLLDNEIAIANFAMANSERLGVAQATCVDRLARGALFNAYMSGNTFITVAASSVTQRVDDTRGFQTVVISTAGVGGTVVPVSVSNPLAVFVNGVANTVTGFSNDVSNISTTAATGGTSGTITLGTTASTTAGQAVISAFAPFIVRPNGRSTSFAIQSTDLLNMKSILAAVTYLRNNKVPKIRGRYNLFCNATSMNQLFQDPEFQLLNSTRGVSDPVYKNAEVTEFLDVRMIMTTETYVQAAGAVDGSITIPQGIERPIVCGAGVLVEEVFTQGLDAIKNLNGQLGIGQVSQSAGMRLMLPQAISKMGFSYYIRPPIDRLMQIMSQTSNYVGGFVVPTDTTTTSAIIPTASNKYYKRAVVIETASG